MGKNERKSVGGMGKRYWEGKWKKRKAKWRRGERGERQEGENQRGGERKEERSTDQ